MFVVGSGEVYGFGLGESEPEMDVGENSVQSLSQNGPPVQFLDPTKPAAAGFQVDEVTGVDAFAESEAGDPRPIALWCPLRFKGDVVQVAHEDPGARA